MILTKILEASKKFTKEQRKMKITPTHISESEELFGELVGIQMGRDALSGFPFWDGASMIEQSWEVFQSGVGVDEFVKWSLEQLGVKDAQTT